MATVTKGKTPQRAAPQPSRPQQQQQPKAPSREVATRPAAGGLSAAVADAAAQYAGAGLSSSQEDNIVPLAYLLQSNSPQTVRGHEKHIDGAQAGDIWLRNEPEGDNIINGQDGMVFQPCYFSKCWIEWLPDRGGFVSRHPQRPEDAELKSVVTDNGTEVQRWVRANGNMVVETREYAGLVHVEGRDPLPYVLPFSGSGHTPAKQWMTSANQMKLPNGAKAPIFAYLWRLTPKLRTKGPNSWYQYDVALEGPVQKVEDIEMGAAIFTDFQSGAKQAAADEYTAAAETGGADDVDAE